MSEAAHSTREAAGPVGSRRWWRPRRPGRRVLAGGAVLLVVIGAVVAVTIPFGDGPASGAADNSTATSLATVARRSLSSQTQVTGTLGYAGSSTILVPAGTAPADLQKAQQTVDSARAALQAARAALATDSGVLADARAKLAADRRKLATDCAGTNAAGANNGDSSNNGAGSSPCATAAQAVASDEQAVAAAEPKATTDSGSVTSAQVALTAAQKSLTTAASSAVAYDMSATYTMLPSPGSVIRRGRSLYAIGGRPVLLLYGRVTAWRAFRSGMASGPDVAELNANLRALGYGSLLTGDSFSDATARAISAVQAAHGLAQTGELLLGSVVFKPGPVRVKSVIPTVGAAPQAGPVLGVSSTRHQVTIALDAAQQSAVKVGDEVTITLPDNTTTSGAVSAVGSVATPGSQGGSPTIEVHVKLANQAAAGDLVSAPVNVAITTARVDDALVVPVNALLALAGGGYAVEGVGVGGVHQLVPVDLGLFDDSEGLVQVRGAALHAGQRIVVPGA